MASSGTKKRQKPGLIELDPNDKAILVHYTESLVSTEEVGEDGKPLLLAEPEKLVKRLGVSSFKVTSNVTKFAQAIKDKTPLIHESKIPHLVGLLEQLRERMIEQGEGEAPPPDDALSATVPVGGMAKLQKASSVSAADSATPAENARDRIDLRASAPAMPTAKQRQMQARHSMEDEEDEQHHQHQQHQQQHHMQEEDTMRRSSARPGSAARSRADSRDGGGAGGLAGPAPSVSPTFAESNQAALNSGGSVMAKSQGKLTASQQLALDQQQARRPEHARIPLSPEEEEEMERQMMLKREREERMLRDTRKARNAKRAEQAIQIAFRAEQEREAQLKVRESQRRKKEKEKKKADKADKADLSRLDEYMERLYDEDVSSKVRGTALILRLVQTPENLDHFIDNDTVLGALARVLREDYKRSTELVTNILEIFFCFSSFTQLHPILTSNKIGETTLKIMQLELTRYEIRREKEEKARLDSGGAPLASGSIVGDRSTQYLPSGADRNMSSKERDRVEKLTAFLQAQEKLLFVCTYILLNLAQDIAIEVKIRNRKIVRILVSLLQRRGAPFAEDRAFLEELHLLVLAFLKKLSIFEENKREMREHGVIQAAAGFLNELLEPPPGYSDAASLAQGIVPPAPNPELIESVLRLLYNLSFDADMKKEMALAGGPIGGGWVAPRNFGKPNQQRALLMPSAPTSPMAGGPNGGQSQQLILGGQQFLFDRELNSNNLFVRCVELLRKPNPSVRLLSARVLYNLSSDLCFRPLVERALLPDLSILASHILRCPSKLVDPELVALAVNVTWEPEIVDALTSPEVFHALVKRVHQTFDPLLIKLLRNISQLPAHHSLFARFLHELVGMTLKAPTHDFLVESLAVLANVTLPEALYSELLAQHGLLDFLLQHLQPGFTDDDIVLEIVQLLGTLAIDPRAAPLLAHAHLVRSLTNLLTDKIEDLDLVVHIVFAIFKFLLHRETRAAVLTAPHLTDCLLDLVVDPAPEVRHLANMCLDIIMEHDDELRDRIRARRFEAFNREWLQLIASSGAGAGGGSHAAAAGGYGNASYDHGMGESMGDDSADLSGSGEQLGNFQHGGAYGHASGAYGAYAGAGGSNIHELGESGDGLDSYQHDQSRDSLEESEDQLSARR